MSAPTFTIPNAGGTSESLTQAQPDAVDLQALGQGQLNAVLTGCTASTTGTLQVSIASGTVAVGGTQYSVSSGSVTHSSNASGNPRLDLIVYRVGTGLLILTGTAAAAPVFPVPTWTTDVLLHAVYVANGTSSIAASDITDKRIQSGYAGFGLVSTNTSALPLTTAVTTDTQILTGSTGSKTLTLGTTNFFTGQTQLVINEATVSVALAAASGSIDTATLPANSAALFDFDGTNWKTIGNWRGYEDSTNRVAFTTPTPSTGVAFTPNTNGDSVLYIKCTTSTSITVTMGPSTGSENTIVPAVTAPVGAFYTVYVPKSWKVIFTGTVADFTFNNQVV